MKTSVLLLFLLWLLLLLFLASKSSIGRERDRNDEFVILVGSIWMDENLPCIEVNPSQFPSIKCGDLLELPQASTAGGVLHKGENNPCITELTTIGL